MEMAKKIVILKIGGSVITQKHREGVFVRKALLSRIAQELFHAIERDPAMQLIIIHGAGSAGHQPAHKYRLKEGIGTAKEKWHGAFLTRMATQKLNTIVADIFIKNGLRTTPVHPASVLVQKNGKISSLIKNTLDEALKNRCIPLLYGEIVFDTTQGMSICSGDAIAAHLAKHYQATHLLYASDVGGIYDKDPHVYKDAQLIHSIHIDDILSDKKITLSVSHHTDVTGGLKNKITSLYQNGIPKTLRTVAIFNGLEQGSFTKAFEGKSDGTIITM